MVSMFSPKSITRKGRGVAIFGSGQRDCPLGLKEGPGFPELTPEHSVCFLTEEEGG